MGGAKSWKICINIEDFAKEQYAIFENDAQWGFGYGIPNLEFDGLTDYEKYRNMCKSLGFLPRNKANFDKFIELAKIYGGRIKCDITLEECQVPNGINLSEIFGEGS